MIGLFRQVAGRAGNDEVVPGVLDARPQVLVQILEGDGDRVALQEFRQEAFVSRKKRLQAVCRASAWKSSPRSTSTISAPASARRRSVLRNCASTSGSTRLRGTGAAQRRTGSPSDQRGSPPPPRGARVTIWSIRAQSSTLRANTPGRVERVRNRGDPFARPPPGGRFEPHDAAEGGGNPDRADGVAAQRRGGEAGGDGRG